MSKEPANHAPDKPDDDTTTDEQAEFLSLARRLVAVPKEEIDAARSNGPRPKAS